MLVGIWGAVPLIFTLVVPVSELSTADVTVFSALVLFAHGLPLEQKIIQKAGPGMVATTTLRILVVSFTRLFSITTSSRPPVGFQRPSLRHGCRAPSHQTGPFTSGDWPKPC